MLDCAGVYGSHMSPSREALRAIPKIEEKSKHISEPHLWPKICEKYRNEPQKVSKWVSLFRGWRLFGGSWDTFGAPRRLLPPKCTHNASKVFPGTENYLQNNTNRVKNTLKVALKVNSMGTLNLNIRIGDLARRTARSALNVKTMSNFRRN